MFDSLEILKVAYKALNLNATRSHVKIPIMENLYREIPDSGTVEYLNGASFKFYNTFQVEVVYYSPPRGVFR